MAGLSRSPFPVGAIKMAVPPSKLGTKRRVLSDQADGTISQFSVTCSPIARPANAPATLSN